MSVCFSEEELGAEVGERGWLSVMYHYLLQHHMGEGREEGEIRGGGVSNQREDGHYNIITHKKTNKLYIICSFILSKHICTIASTITDAIQIND